jgi:hypothetical protein
MGIICVGNSGITGMGVIADGAAEFGAVNMGTKFTLPSLKSFL